MPETHRNGPRSDEQGSEVPEDHRETARPNWNGPKEPGSLAQQMHRDTGYPADSWQRALDILQPYPPRLIEVVAVLTRCAYQPDDSAQWLAGILEGRPTEARP